jgi:hypothetical protein
MNESFDALVVQPTPRRLPSSPTGPEEPELDGH